MSTSSPKERASGKGMSPSDGPVGGELTVDPTENVKALAAAAAQRQDDLRDLNNKWVQAELNHTNEVGKLRNDHAKELSDTRDSHYKEIREIESKRLDAIRQVDVSAGTTAADRALQAIQVLASTTTANAETLRSMVATTATTSATQTAGTVNAIIERIADLEKLSYQGQGMRTVADPQMAEMILELKSLRDTRSNDQGKSTVADPALAMLAAEVKALREANSVRTGFDAGKVAAIGTGLVGGSVGLTALVMRLLGH